MDGVKAVLLVGGMGTRLRSVVPSTPKALAPIGERSFLELLVRHLRLQGIRRLVMCTGYLSEQIENTFGDGRDFDVAVEYSKEDRALGTGGAVKLARRYLQNQEFLVLNGDSFLEANLGELMAFHREHEDAAATMAVVRVENAGRYGTVEAGRDGRVVKFSEKTGVSAPGLINGGIYVFSESAWKYIPEGASSLEKDVFPRLIDQGVYAREQHGMFIDIGTPEDYARAQHLLRSV
jgi:D-glycero-alpha-D-manno-heptose 1-phosphate guanylyltransferase